MDKEIRSIQGDIHVVQRDNSDDPRQIQGYAVLFNTESVDLGGFIEVIKPNALDGVDLSAVQLIYGHENNSILARVDSGNLTLTVDETGLFFVATLADTNLANDVYQDILAGNLKGMSFGFTIPEDGDDWIFDQGDTAVHVVNKIGDVVEITITPNPAYQDTSVSVKRSLDEARKDKENMNEAEIVNAVKKLLEERDAAKVKPADEKTDKSSDEKPDDKPDDKETSSKEKRDDAVEEQPDEQEERSSVKEKIERSTKKEVEQKEEKRNTEMPKVIERNSLSTDETIKRSYIDALKDVNTRDGVTVDAEGAVLVPKQILDIQKVPEDNYVLAHYINRVAVSTPTGSLPILAKSTARLATKAELAKNPDLAKASISSVDYKVQTYIGQLPISKEMLQDYPQSQDLVSNYLSVVKTASEDEAIGKVLSTKFGANTATSLDDLKSAYNKLVNYGADRVIVLTNSAFDAIDKLKDNEGRYYVQPSVTASTGSSLFGAPVINVPDTTLGKAGDMKVFVGSLKASVIEAVRLDGLATNWAQNDYFEQILSVATRFDVQQADKAAGAFYTFTPAPASGLGH